jgi:ribokinase
MSAPVVIVGSLNADLFVEVAALPRPGETVRGSDLTVRPGGKGANQAAAAGLLGAAVTMVGAVGTDDYGRLLLAAAESAGVRTARIRTLDVATGTAMITVDGAGENTIIISAGANDRLSADDARAGIGAGTAVVGLCLEIPADTVAAAVLRAREVGATVVLNLSPYRRVDREVLAGVDLLLVNEVELEQLVGTFDELLGALGRLAEAGVGRAVVTLGDAGAAILDAAAGTSQRVASPTVEVLDTTGCGDAFAGALISRLAAGDEVADAVATAVRVGAYAATGKGAQPSYPTAQQLAAWTP